MSWHIVQSTRAKPERQVNQNNVSEPCPEEDVDRCTSSIIKPELGLDSRSRSPPQPRQHERDGCLGLCLGWNCPQTLFFEPAIMDIMVVPRL